MDVILLLSGAMLSIRSLCYIWILEIPWNLMAPGGHSITKHMGGWLEGLSQKPQNISPKIVILENAKIIPPKYSYSTVLELKD